MTHRGKTWKVVYVSDNRALILEGGKTDLEDGLSISPFSDLPRVKHEDVADRAVAVPPESVGDGADTDDGGMV